MSRMSHEDSLESRTPLSSKKRSHADSSTSRRSRKRRRNNLDHKPQNSISNNNQFTSLSTRSDLDQASNKEPVSRRPSNSVQLSSPDPPSEKVPTARWPSSFVQVSEQDNEDEMASNGFGRNRLAMGFKKPTTVRHNSKSSGEISSSSSAQNEFGNTSASPIEISDDEMGESEGGMVINVDQDTSSSHSIAYADFESQESGEVPATPKNKQVTPVERADLFVVDPTPSLPVKRLSDLTTEELEDQMRYAFFHLNRDQIDLSRPVICLGCSDEGHLHQDCASKGTELFPAPRVDPKVQIKLWISCCICASRLHLVGDCPELRGDGTRWSLKSIGAENVINLSLESGTRKLEQDAGNAGMRPVGLQIKGRAGMHNAGVRPHNGSSEDDDEPFLRRPVRKRQPGTRDNPSRSQRYDRFDPPSNQQGYRGGGEWYVTDSFGRRRRSRSPDDHYDSYRPRDEFSRSRASPPRDSWRPPASNEHRQNYRPRMSSPSSGGRAPTSTNRAPTSSKPGHNIQVSLPTRKGSNTWSQSGQSGTSTPTTSGKPTDQNPQRRRPRNRRRGGQNS